MKLETYDDYVREGKKLLHAVGVHQCTISWMASQVCFISHGGRSKGYTLSDYARDIGMHRKTLSEWSLVYRHVIQRLEIDLSDITQDDWMIATRVSNLLRDEKRQMQESSGQQRRKGRAWDIKLQIPTERIRDLFNTERNGRSAQAAVNGWTDTVINIKNNIRRAELSTVSTVSLKSLKKNLDEASNEITNYLLNNKGVPLAELTVNGGINV